jgi:small conductance mechanosensitive channel
LFLLLLPPKRSSFFYFLAVNEIIQLFLNNLKPTSIFNMDTTAYLEKLLDLVIYYGPKLLGAILLWFIGKWLIKMLVKGLTKLLTRQRMDPSLRPFLLNLIGIVLKALLLISVLGMLGVEMTSFIALLGAIGLAVGMALSGTLQNFVGGVVLLFFKPFKIGDYIKTQGHEGIVKEIQLFHTVLKP